MFQNNTKTCISYGNNKPLLHIESRFLETSSFRSIVNSIQILYLSNNVVCRNELFSIWTRKVIFYFNFVSTWSWIKHAIKLISWDLVFFFLDFFVHDFCWEYKILSRIRAASKVTSPYCIKLFHFIARLTW